MRTLALALAACLLATPTWAAKAPDARAGFVKSCETQMYYSAAVCTCMADKAKATLSPTAIAYLSLPALDVVHSSAMAKAMSGSDRNSIDNFMKTAPHQCSGK
jgi:hypothetical protein